MAVTKVFSRRLFLAALGAGAAGMAQANPPAVSLRPLLRPEGFARHAAAAAEDLIRQARLGGDVGFAVIDVKDGRMLEARAAGTGQPPASVTKAVTALYALEALGAGYRFRTRLIATGPVEEGVLRGDLVLAGGGDPTLDTDGLAQLAARLKAAGVREVAGAFRVYGGALPFVRELDSSQPVHVGYNPAISGLNLNHNRVHFEWKRSGDGYRVTLDARTRKYRPEVRVSRMSVAGRRSPVYTYRDRGDYDDWTVARAALGNGGARWLPVRKPEAYAGEVFATFARARGIVLKSPRPQDAAPEGAVLASHESRPLSEVLRGMLKYSNNLTAEAVGMTATAVRTGRVASLGASARAMSAWARTRLGMQGARLVDHSGLGDRSRLTPEATARVLAGVHGDGVLKPLFKTIPLRDDGSGIEVAAKTGTLYFVSSLAGYMTAPGGADLAFAIFTSNARLRARIDRAKDERPDGARSWNKRAKTLQKDLIKRWGGLYGG